MSRAHLPSTLEMLRQFQVAAAQRRSAAAASARGGSLPMFARRPHGPLGRPMRIAVVGGRGVPSTYSGVEVLCEGLFAEFAAMGHKVTVYCRPGVLDEEQADYKGMRLIRTPCTPGKLETVTHTLASCAHAVRVGATNGGGEPFDVISFHAIPPNLAQRIPALAGIPTIAHVHGLDHMRGKWRGLGARLILEGEREMVRHAAHVVTVNGELVRYYREQYGIDATYLPNGVHPVSDDFRPDRPTLDRFGLRPGGYFVMVSRLVPEKRHEDVIAAFKRLDSSMRLVIVGEGNQSGEHVRMLTELAAKDPRIVFTGHQSGDALQTLFRCAFAYVTASELEGMPASLLECMERKVCAIVSNIVPHLELTGTIDGYNLGFRVGDVDGIERSLRRAMRAPEHVAALGRRMREFVRAHYGWPGLAEATEQLYQRVLSDRRRGRVAA